MSENEFGHKDWPTVPGEKTLEKIRELIEAPIWVIVYNYPYDSGHYTPDWEERVETEDYGFFRTEEAAQAFVDKKNDHGAKYEKYVADRARGNEREQASYDERKAKWDSLAEKGLNPADYMPEPRLALSETKTFEQMVRVFEAEEYYSIQKVEFNRG